MYEDNVEVSSSELDMNSNMEVDRPLSVHDHEAFAQRYMTDLGQEVEDFKVFTWKIQDYRRMAKRINSPEFECGGHKWNILLFPQGNSNGQASDMVSVYLNYGDPKAANEGWYCCAQFILAISNPNDGTVYVQSQAQHRFNAEEIDWGFTRFHEYKKLFQPTQERGRPIIENDETEITAFVRVLKDPTGVLWHNFQNYDSKKETGFVGLKNQGATCYMNSLLQSLFFTGYYRKAVYQIPTENDTTDSVPLALQRVFYHLQTSDVPVSTTELTKSFGWKGFDSFLQHDVQEFNRVLQDKLESKMKGTSVDGAIHKLFCGRMKSFIKCINVDYESSRSEEYYDLQLNVKGFRNVEESFRDYLQVETLDGDNKYFAEGHGLQDAKKGVVFESFPPVLHLQLKRYEYDFQRDTNVKINDRYEFSFELDVKPFLDPALPTEVRQDDWIYHLHGVLVHSGDVHGGHYFAFIKPTVDGKWLKWDDDRVTRVIDREVLEDNFGGELVNNNNNNNNLNNNNNNNNGFNNNDPQFVGVKSPLTKAPMKRFTNAYMLVYVRKKLASEILSPMSENDIPAPLQNRLEQEKTLAETKRREREEQHKYMTVKVVTDEAFRKHEGFDLANFDDRQLPHSLIKSYNVAKEQSFVDFKNSLIEQRPPREGQSKLWVLVNRQNKTVRPDASVHDDDSTLTMETVRDKMTSRQTDLKLYLEELEPNEMERWVERYGNEQPIMIFVKRFSVEEQSLKGFGRFYVHKHMKVADLAVAINERMGYPPNTPLKIYEEIKPGMIDPLKQKATFLQSEIQDGDIVCFQTESSENTMDVDVQNKFLTPVHMYEFFVNRILVQFRPKFPDNNNPTDENNLNNNGDNVNSDHENNIDTQNQQLPEFELTLSKKNNYEFLAKKVGEELNYDPQKLRFTTTNPQNGTPKAIVRKAYNSTVGDILQPSSFNHSQYYNVLFYELLDIPLHELENKKNVKITWMGLHNKEEDTPSFLVPKMSTIKELSDMLLSKVTCNPDGSGSGKIRIFQNDQCRKQIELSSSEIIRDQDVSDLYAEEIPNEELDMSSDDKVVGVYHFSKEPARAHSVPFNFVIKPNEPFSETKKRLQMRLGASDKEFAKFKFSLVQPSTYSKPSYLNDDDVLHTHRWQEDDLLGVDHLDRSIKRTGMERAVVIR